MVTLTPPALPSRDAIARLIEERVDSFRLARGMVVATTEAGARSVAAYGHAVGRQPVAEDTLFEIGSVTKLFTALLLAEMANRGEVALNEPVAKLLPPGVGVPSHDGREITLRDLAAHRSGLPRLPDNLAPYDASNPYAHYTPNLLYAFLAGHKLSRAPGDQFEYSNLGFGLLGHALTRRAGGGSYETLLRQRILTPLNMNDTVIALPVRLRSRLASPHDCDLNPVPLWNLNVLAGAGALRSTAIDLLGFLEAFGDPASPIAALVQPLLTPYAEGGLAFVPPHPDRSAVIVHDGGTGGCRSFVQYSPAWKRGVAVLSNAASEAATDLGLHVMDTRHPLQQFRRETDVSVEQLKPLIGRYQLNPENLLDILLVDGRLYAQLSGQESLPIYPSAERAFFFKLVDAQITFASDENGRIVRLVLHQNGQDITAERL